MNERQQALFLWDWHRKRAAGQGRVLLLIAAIGAVGGALFALLMFGLPALAGQTIEVNTDEMAPFLAALARLLGPVGFMLLLAVPAFAVLALVVGWPIVRRQEALYQSLLASGARVPTERPMLKASDSAGKWIVIGVGLALIVFLLTMTVLELTGQLAG